MGKLVLLSILALTVAVPSLAPASGTHGSRCARRSPGRSRICVYVGAVMFIYPRLLN